MRAIAESVKDLDACDVDTPIIETLDRRIDETLTEIRSQDFWQALTSPETPKEVIGAVLRQAMIESACYTPRIIEAAISTVGRMPKAEAKMIQRMLIHLAEESNHGEIAFQDYVSLGGDSDPYQRQRMSIPGFAVASWWWGVWRMEDPFVYLGGMYVFESITPIVAAELLDLLRQKGISDSEMEFMTLHAVEDIKHQNMMKKLIVYACERFPNAEAAITYGLESFLYLYPMPLWREIWGRVIKETGFHA